MLTRSAARMVVQQKEDRLSARAGIVLMGGISLAIWVGIVALVRGLF